MRSDCTAQCTSCSVTNSTTTWWVMMNTCITVGQKWIVLMIGVKNEPNSLLTWLYTAPQFAFWHLFFIHVLDVLCWLANGTFLCGQRTLVLSVHSRYQFLHLWHSELKNKIVHEKIVSLRKKMLCIHGCRSKHRYVTFCSYVTLS